MIDARAKTVTTVGTEPTEILGGKDYYTTARMPGMAGPDGRGNVSSVCN